jgi:hypothetical protein
MVELLAIKLYEHTAIAEGNRASWLLATESERAAFRSAARSERHLETLVHPSAVRDEPKAPIDASAQRDGGYQQSEEP